MLVPTAGISAIRGRRFGVLFLSFILTAKQLVGGQALGLGRHRRQRYGKGHPLRLLFERAALSFGYKQQLPMK